MSLIRLFIDEEAMDRQFVRALRARGVDVTTVGEISLRLATYKSRLLDLQVVLFQVSK